MIKSSIKKVIIVLLALLISSTSSIFAVQEHSISDSDIKESSDAYCSNFFSNTIDYAEYNGMTNLLPRYEGMDEAIPVVEQEYLDDGDAFEPGSILVKLTSNIDISNVLGTVRHITVSDPLFVPVLSIKPVFFEGLLARNFEYKSSLGLNRWFKIIFKDDTTDILREVEKYNKNPLVECAQPNYKYHSFEIPNDEYFDDQWALHNTGQTGGTPDADIDAPEAWDIETGSSDVIMAIVDTGVDYNHSDLAEKIWVNPGEDINGNGIVDEEDFNGLDDDENGFIDDLRGWDFCNNDNDPMDDHAHGTHCAGIANAMSDNGIGIAGICWDSTIMPLKFIDNRGYGYDTNASEAIIYAADNGADIISNSWGYYSSSQILEDAIDYAAETSIIAAAAGNEGFSLVKGYPAAYDNVVAVAATGHNDIKSQYSNYGTYDDRWIDVCAPGEYILSTILGDLYAYASGTSMATPMVAGVAGLVKSYHPDWSNERIIGQVLSTADDIESLNPVHAGFIGTGRINAYNALTTDPQTSIIFKRYTVDDSSGNNNEYLEPGETVDLYVTLRNNWLDATNVKATLSTLHPHIRIISSSASFGDMATFEQLTDYFTISLDSDASHGQLIDCDLTISADGGYEETIPIKIIVDYSYQAGWPAIAQVANFYTDQSINIGDIDNNGDLETVICLIGSVYALNHRGEIVDGWPVRPGGGNYRGPALGDLNGDGCLEVVFTSIESIKVHIYNHQGEEITDGWPKTLDDLNMGESPTIADVDNDGELEIIATSMWHVYAFNFDGSNVSGFPISLRSYGILSINSLAVGDVNNDGFQEILITCMFGARPYKHIFVLSHSGDVLYEWQPEVLSSTNSDSPPVLADLNNDGTLEIILNGASRLFVWRYNGETVFTKDLGRCNYAVGDVNGDESLDIIINNINKIYAFDSQGNPLDGNWPISIDNISWYTGAIDPSTPVLADIDGDNEVEVIITGISENEDTPPGPYYNWEIYAFNGDGSIVDAQGLDFPIVVNFPLDPCRFLLYKPQGTNAIADLDQDGDVEICSYAIAVAPHSSFLLAAAFDLPYYYNHNPYKTPWPMLRHDLQHTAAYIEYTGSLGAEAAGPYYGMINEPVQFKGSAYGGVPPYSWHWDFGDSNTSEEQNPAHNYSTADTYTITLTVTDQEGNSSSDTTLAIIGAEDTENPNVLITRPEKALYIFNKKIKSLVLIRRPVIIGSIDIEVDASDDASGINRVEFYIDNKLKHNDTTPPYNWTWDERTLLKFRHTIKVIAYDLVENNASQQIQVWEFF